MSQLDEKIKTIDEDIQCESARGPDADRGVKLLIQFAVEGSLTSAYSQAAEEERRLAA
jgi:hypothetical protein